MQPSLRLAALALCAGALVALGPGAAALGKTQGHATGHAAKKTKATAGEPSAHGVPIPRARPRPPATRVASASSNTPAQAPAAIAQAAFSPNPIAAALPAAMTPFATGTPGPSAPHRAVVPPARPAAPFAATPTAQTSSADLSAVKQVVDLLRRGKPDNATEVARGVSDPLAAKLAEWLILRSEDNGASFGRYAAFLANNPSWPSLALLRRKAEAALWEDKADPATIRAFFATENPVTAKGRFALARALIAQGDRKDAEAYVRQAWRHDAFSPEVEQMALEAFGDMLTRADHKARMDERLYAGENDAAMREAQRLGGADLAIARARIAVAHNAANAKALLDAVPDEAARHDAGCLFSLIHWLRHKDEITEATRLMLAAPRDPALLHDTDQWWIERRLLARKLLDLGDAKSAYLVARDAAPPTKENYRAEHQFTAGWIALRFLNDPATALAHFAHIGDGITNPIALARAGYWEGRAAEALGRRAEARAYYESAAHYSTAYYGQLARARLGLPEIVLRAPPEPGADRRSALARLEVVRAVEILYAVNERDFVLPFMVDLAERAQDIGVLTAIAELARRHDDARAMLLLGKAALARGFAFDHYAFPATGIPRYSAVGPEVDPSVVYSIVRQESEFNQRDVSSANALGLMQVTPEAARYVAKKFNAKYDVARLRHDASYNMSMGAAELGDLIRDYRGSYIMAFAGYNAGRGRVREWVARYGDPRDPGVDPVDWVERIPFSETRNYVQRVMENVQVYRARFGGGTRLLIESDLRRGTAEQ